MKILHTEASPGWGGQELRILKEAQGMRERGHEVIFALQKGGGLVAPARASGFVVFEFSFKKLHAFSIIRKLISIIRKYHIDIINTHSSLDAWLGGLVGKLCGCYVIRTRHLSTPIRAGLNSRLLYNWLADYVVTTCDESSQVLQKQALLPASRCQSIPTGVDPVRTQCNPEEVLQFRKSLGLNPEDCLAGTLCILRGWKGVTDLLHAAKLLKDLPHLKWLVIGSGVSEHVFRAQCKDLGLEDRVIFTGHLSPPYTALAALDIFLLLSWANEGVSQASLQAAWLEKPLITTSVGGLKEVCIHNKTGFQVPKHDPYAVSQAVLELVKSASLRTQMGQKAKALVLEKFTLNHTLDAMEAVYHRALS